MNQSKLNNASFGSAFSASWLSQDADAAADQPPTCASLKDSPLAAVTQAAPAASPTGAQRFGPPEALSSRELMARAAFDGVNNAGTWGTSPSVAGQRPLVLPEALLSLRDPEVRQDPQALCRLYDVAMENTRDWLPKSLSPEETSLTAAEVYRDVFRKDPTAIWFGLGPYASAKVGEAFQGLDMAKYGDPSDVGIVNQGFSEANRAIFKSVFALEQFYQAGGTEAVRAMVAVAPEAFGAHWGPDNQDFRNRLVESLELRDQARVHFSEGRDAQGKALLDKSLRASLDFEQRVVAQHFYESRYTHADTFGIPVTKPLRQAINDIMKGPELFDRDKWGTTPWNMMIEAYQRYASTVTIEGRTRSFEGSDVGDPEQRMVFVHGIVDMMMASRATPAGERAAGASASVDWQNERQQLLRDQEGMLVSTYGQDLVDQVRTRLGR